MNIIQNIEKNEIQQIEKQRNAPIPDFYPGDSIKVSVKVVEGTKKRIQIFEGVCISRSGRGIDQTFVVRKISFGEGVERIFPLYSPAIDKVEVVKHGKVRRAKLYYLRNLRGKAARIAEKKTGIIAKKNNLKNKL